MRYSYRTFNYLTHDSRSTRKKAIEMGYRLVDCAPRYENQVEIGKGIQKCLDNGLVQRADLFIISKLYHTDHRPSHVIPALQQTLEELNVSYLDCWMMHAPWSFVPFKDDEISCKPREDKFGAMVEEIDFVDTWREMEKCIELGLCRSIAVSNFNSKQLERLIANCSIKPIINQVESHLYFNNERLNKFCTDRDIRIMAFHPIGETRVKIDDISVRNDKELNLIAHEYKRTSVQVLLRYHIQRGIIPIPKSSKFDHIKENREIFDFTLTPDTMTRLTQMDVGKRFYVHQWIKKLSKFYPFTEGF